MIEMLPLCDRCGVAYVEDYSGPCQETIGSGGVRCPGTVSWRATTAALAKDRDALLKVEEAARRLDALFTGTPWRLDGQVVGDDAMYELLSLHDHLNDVTIAREASP